MLEVGPEVPEVLGPLLSGSPTAEVLAVKPVATTVEELSEATPLSTAATVVVLALASLTHIVETGKRYSDQPVPELGAAPAPRS